MATATAASASPKRRKLEDGRPAARGIVAWRAAIAVAALFAGATVVATARFNARVALDDARERVEHGTPPNDPAIQALVRQALRRDLTQPAALELTALADENRGHPKAAARLYRLSDQISRRSLATRLWLVQDAVGRGDVAGTLANMELALRTSSAAPAFVFPALVRGLDDAKLVQPIATLVERPSDWREAFLIFAADNADPSSAAALFFAVHDRRLISKDELDRKVVVRLVGDGQFTLARQLDTAFGGRPVRAQLVPDGNFDDFAARYPFGWGLTERAELGAARQIDDGHSVLAFHATVAEGGQVAAQLLTLPPGSYALETQAGRQERVDTPPLWTLSCAAPATLIVTLALPSEPHATSTALFAIPPDCPAQWLALTVRPALTPQSGSVQEVTVAAR